MTDPHPTERRCAGCGQPRARLSGGHCLECVGGAQGERSRADALIAYVREHPGITVLEASRILGVSPHRISELIDSGRLQVSAGARTTGGAR